MATVSGGKKIKPALVRMLANAGKARQVSVGFMADSTYPDGTSVAMVAAVQEFGAPSKNIPPRPFFRTMIAKHKDEWPTLAAQALKNSDFDTNKALSVVGLAIAGQLQQSIVDLTSPPLSPITLMLRGMRSQKRYRGIAFYKLRAIAAERVASGQTNYSAPIKPLIDTDTMSNSVSVVVT